VPDAADRTPDLDDDDDDAPSEREELSGVCVEEEKEEEEVDVVEVDARDAMRLCCSRAPWLVESCCRLLD
jgi:hypothetical protein